MKNYILIFTILLLVITEKTFSQVDNDKYELGISVGGYSNFPLTKDFLKDYSSVINVSPYIILRQHEISVGLSYPLSTSALFFKDENISPRPGFSAGYKFFVFNIYGRENMFIHYSFEYLKYSGQFNVTENSDLKPGKYTEKDMYINNVIGLGYNLYFDMNERFGFFYILDYVISRTDYHVYSDETSVSKRSTNYVWNNLSNRVGLTFKIAAIR